MTGEADNPSSIKQYRKHENCLDQRTESMLSNKGGMFAELSSNVRYLVEGTLKFSFYKHKEHPILFIFSHLAKQMPVEMEKE